MVANNKRSPQVDFVIDLRALQKVWLRFYAFAFIGALVRTTVDRSNADSGFTQASHDVLIDSEGLLSADVPLGNSALVRYDK